MKVPQLVKPTGRYERVGFWVIVAAAVIVIVALAGFVLGPVWAALGTGLVVGLFAALITALNLSALAAPANRVLGSRVFPVVNVGDRGVARLIVVNSALMFAVSFLFEWLRSALHLGSILSALLVLVAVAVGGTLINRARKVVEHRGQIGEAPITIDGTYVDSRERVA